jgi:hypothetical protein
VSCQEHADKLRQTIEDGISGHGDEAALRVIASEAATLRCCPELSEFAYQKVGAVYHWAEIYFSPDKQRQWRGRLRQVKLRLLQELSSLQSSLPPEDSLKT